MTPSSSSSVTRNTRPGVVSTTTPPHHKTPGQTPHSSTNQGELRPNHAFCSPMADRVSNPSPLSAISTAATFSSRCATLDVSVTAACQHAKCRPATKHEVPGRPHAPHAEAGRRSCGCAGWSSSSGLEVASVLIPPSRRDVSGHASPTVDQAEPGRPIGRSRSRDHVPGSLQPRCRSDETGCGPRKVAGRSVGDPKEPLPTLRPATSRHNEKLV